MEEVKFTGATLLSSEEVKDFLTEDERRYKYWWWLRSPGDNSYYASSVYKDGYVYYRSNVYATGRGVRPALKISNLKSTKYIIGDYITFDNKTFKIISNDLAFMINDDIGYCRFDEKSNDYESSEIKKYVDDWFNKVSSRCENLNVKAE